METGFQLVAIAGTIGLLLATLNYLKRFRESRVRAPRVQVEQRVPLASGCQLVVVRWDNQEMLLAAGGQTCSLIASKAVSGEARGAWAQ